MTLFVELPGPVFYVIFVLILLCFVISEKRGMVNRTHFTLSEKVFRFLFVIPTTIVMYILCLIFVEVGIWEYLVLAYETMGIDRTHINPFYEIVVIIPFCIFALVASLGKKIEIIE